MHLFAINILIFYVFYMFRTRGFIQRKTVQEEGCLHVDELWARNM